MIFITRFLNKEKNLNNHFRSDLIENALMWRIQEFLARPTRFERATPAFGGRYSIQLSYGRFDE
jgi:hypothetical protein